jgi:hypothetical protein
MQTLIILERSNLDFLILYMLIKQTLDKIRRMKNV